MTDPPDLAVLTGLRSGKRSYYREFRRSDERMQRTVHAMDGISRAMVRTAEGPRALIEEVVRAAGLHLHADWVLLALADNALPDSRPRFLALDGAGTVHDTGAALPERLCHELAALRSGDPCLAAVDPDGWVRVGMTLDGIPVGGLVALHGLDTEPEQADLSALRILANQAAVSMHTSNLYQAGLSLRRRAQQLYDEASRRARELAARDAELWAAEQRLLAANQRALIDNERHRIALELHDTVAQFVLSAGLEVDVCRADVAGLVDGEGISQRLGIAKDLMCEATDKLRSAIYALHHERGSEDVVGLPELLQEVADQHRPHLAVSLHVEGRPIALGVEAEHSLARTAGEALFNVSMHARATRAVVRLRYAPTEVSLWVSDDGRGDATEMRRLLRFESIADSDGRHRGLANMAGRARELGGTFAIRRSRLGGVRIEVRVPLGAAA